MKNIFDKSYLPRLRFIFLILNVAVIAFPIGSLVFVRFYDSALVRQVERDLILQAELIDAAYLTLFKAYHSEGVVLDKYGIPRVDDDDLGEFPNSVVYRGGLNVYSHPLAPDLQQSPSSGAPDPLAVTIGNELELVLREASALKRTKSRSRISLIDFHGFVSNSTAIETGERLINRIEVEAALEGHRVSVMRQRHFDFDEAPPLLNRYPFSLAGQRIITVVHPIVYEDRVFGAVVIESRSRGLHQVIMGHRILFGAGILILPVILVLIAFLYSQVITKPIKKVIKQAERVVAGERGAVRPLENPMSREVDELSRSLATMSEILEERAEEVRRRSEQIQKGAVLFRTVVSDATHDILNQLTPAIGNAKLMREENSVVSQDQRDQYLAEFANDMVLIQERTEALDQRAEEESTSFEKGRANVREVLEKIGERFGRHRLNVAIDLSSEATEVSMSRDLLQSMIAGLIGNAYQHGGKNVNVSIEVTNTQKPRVMVQVTVSDDGIGIPEDFSHQIFKSGVTTAAEKGHKGQGLANAKTLLEAHGGKIRLLPSDRGAAFQISIPVPL